MAEKAKSQSAKELSMPAKEYEGKESHLGKIGKPAVKKKIKEKIKPHTKGNVDNLKNTVKTKTSKEKKETLDQESKDLEVFRKVGKITGKELGAKIEDKMAELNDKKEGEEVTDSEYKEAKEKIISEAIKGLSEGELMELMKARTDELGSFPELTDGTISDKTLYQIIKDKNPELGKTLDSFDNPELAKKALATYGPERMKALNPIIEELKKEGKELPENLEAINKLLEAKIAKKLQEEHAESNDGEKLSKEELQQAVSNVMQGPSSGFSGAVGGSNEPVNYDNINYTPGEEYPKEIQEQLEKIYNPIEDKENARMLDTLKHLSNFHDAKMKFAKFIIEADKSGYKLTQGNGTEGGVRTLDKQREIMGRAGATKVKDPARSWHTKGAAIDLIVNGKPVTAKDVGLLKIASNNGLFSGGQMWDFDDWHFQAGCSGKICKDTSRYQAKANKGLLPKNVAA